MMWFFILFLATVSAINLPKVTVEKQLLAKYGVTKDVNQPNFVDNAYARFKEQSARNPGLVNIDTSLALLDSSISVGYPVHVSLQAIKLSEFVHGDELMMAVTAHSLNVWQRFQQTAEATNLEEFSKFKAVFDAKNDTIISICRKDSTLLKLAHPKMREYNPVSACDKFLEDFRRDPTFLKNRMDTSFQARKNLDELENMVNNGDLFNFFQIKLLLENKPVIDPFMYDYFNESLKKNLEDYAQVVEELSKDEDLKKVVDKVSQKIGAIAAKMQ